MKVTEQNLGWVSALAYTGGSLLAALAFFTVATLTDHNWVARLGGATWVFGLSMIILMPTLQPLLRSWATGEKLQLASHDHDAMLREEAERREHKSSRQQHH